MTTKTQEHNKPAGGSYAEAAQGRTAHLLAKSLVLSDAGPIHPLANRGCTLRGTLLCSKGLGNTGSEPIESSRWVLKTTAGRHQPSGLGRQPVEDAPSGASSANTLIRRQCTHLEPDLQERTTGEIPCFCLEARARGTRALACWEAPASAAKMAHGRNRKQCTAKFDVDEPTPAFNRAEI